MPADNDLHKAAHKGDLDTCKMLIESTADEVTPMTVHDKGAAERTPMHRAAGAGHMDIVVYFLELGADVNAVDKSGRTSLHWAGISGHSEVIKLLIDEGVNICAKTTSDNTALHSAVEGSRLDTIKLLLEAASKDEAVKTELAMAKNGDGKTAWDLAFGAKNKPVCTALKEGGDPNGASSSCVIS
jgi:ankyrin repeat protein